MCLVVTILLIIGGLNWGLEGLGYFFKTNLNVVNLILGSWPVVEAIVYLLVGVSAVMMLYFYMSMKDCGCEKMDKKM